MAAFSGRDHRLNGDWWQRAAAIAAAAVESQHRSRLCRVHLRPLQWHAPADHVIWVGVVGRPAAMASAEAGLPTSSEAMSWGPVLQRGTTPLYHCKWLRVTGWYTEKAISL